MSGIDMSKLKKISPDEEKRNNSSFVPSIAKNSLPMKATGAVTPMLGSNAVFIWMKMLYDLVNNGIQTVGTVLIEKERTKQYKIQADAFIAGQKELTNRIYEEEKTKRMQILKDYQEMKISLLNDKRKIELFYQDKDKKRMLRREERKQIENMANTILEHAIKCQEKLFPRYIEQNCDNVNIKEQIDNFDEQIKSVMAFVMTRCKEE